MIPELQPVYRQLEETMDALRVALAEIPDERLQWRPGPMAKTASSLAQHIVRANTTYANFMSTGTRGERPEEEPGLDRQGILARVDRSMDQVRTTFETLPAERLHAVCADEWDPIGALVQGPLDAFWFAMQMITHSAYHVGQIVMLGLLLEGESTP